MAHLKSAQKYESHLLANARGNKKMCTRGDSQTPTM